MKVLLILVISFFLFLECKSETEYRKEQRPNILIINIDDMGWRDVGFMGSQFYETPNIDRLALGGMVFTNAYASASNCAPSRACLMSGQWTPRHGIYTVGSSERGKAKDRKLIPTKNNEYMSPENLLLPQALQQAGYVTCHAGKWHLSDDPTTFGFQRNIGGSHAGNPGSYYPPYKNVRSIKEKSDDEYLTIRIMDEVLNFIDTLKNRPFFLYYAPYAVHTPIQPIKSLQHKYESKATWNGQQNSAYATMIENLDTQVGRLVQNLSQEGLLENTLILFTSDNGGVFRITKQWPLRAGKGSYYEGGIRVPMFAYWKERIESGNKSEVLVSNLDFYPTILEIAGINNPSGKVLDGSSLVPIIFKREQPDRSLYWHFPIYLEGGNEETQDPKFRTRPGSAVRKGDWKLIQYFENNDIELYNLRTDIEEKHNLVSANPDKARQLLKDLNDWREQVDAPLPLSLNPSYKRNEK